MNKNNTINIKGIDYIPKPSTQASKDGLPYVVVRSRDSGCHAGYLKRRDGAEVELVDSRRLWFWSGASTLSQLSQEGVKNPGECKFPCPVPCMTVLGVCEVIPATEAAKISIEEVPEWKQ